jgi:hypothetical protein
MKGQYENQKHKVRPLKLDDRILVSAHMRFWPRIKKVYCSSFLKKPHQNPCFLADDLASGHISWSHFGKSRLSHFQVLSVYLRMHFSTCYGVWVVWIAHAFQYMLWCLGCMNIDSRPRFVLISCLCLSGSLGLKIDPCVNSQECKDERWKLTKFPHCFLTRGPRAWRSADSIQSWNDCTKCYGKHLIDIIIWIVF